MRKILITFLFCLFAVNVFGSVEIIKLPKPYFYLSKKNGGSIPAGTYYFLGFYGVGRYSTYYGGAMSPSSDEYSITISSADVTAGTQTINIEWFADGGDISAFADAGGGSVTVTASNHAHSNGDTIYIRDTTSYDGTTSRTRSS